MARPAGIIFLERSLWIPPASACYRQVLSLLLAWAVMIPDLASTQTIENVIIVEYGQYHAVSGLSQYSGSMGQLHAVRNVKLIAATTAIPARLKTRFGLRYIVDGEPHGMIVHLQMVTRFPEGGLVNSATGQRHQSLEYRMPVRLGDILYREYSLDETWEIAPGRWVFEFWLNGRKLAEQEFCLFEPSRSAFDCTQAVSDGSWRFRGTTFTNSRVW